MEDLIQNLHKVCSLIRRQLYCITGVCVLATAVMVLQTASMMIKVNRLDAKASYMEQDLYKADVVLERLMYEVDKLVHEGTIAYQADRG
jgi:hypothetical protein